ncbi:MAG: alpha/beta hydrolase-fold protein [Candidatus Melainabacteria bacterium]|nr:alpha/beta hydrolase-fold protein [Candidatus Melainabacteria bacterium]
MIREYHSWHSPILNREMELLTFGDSGARVIVFPTSCGRFYDWENREMIKALSHHIDQGWIQVFCVDSVDRESWWNLSAHPKDKASRHLTYQKYVVEEVLPFTEKKNDNNFVIALGASMGAYHAMSIALRYPLSFHRTIGMSGPYDFEQMSGPYSVFNWIHDHSDDVVDQCNPSSFIRNAPEEHLAKIRKMDIIFAIGETDPLFESNRILSEVMAEKKIPHAYRVWDGFAHDWPFWHEMVLHYIGGDGTR